MRLLLPPAVPPLPNPLQVAEYRRLKEHAEAKAEGKAPRVVSASACALRTLDALPADCLGWRGGPGGCAGPGAARGRHGEGAVLDLRHRWRRRRTQAMEQARRTGRAPQSCSLLADPARPRLPCAAAGHGAGQPRGGAPHAVQPLREAGGARQARGCAALGCFRGATGQRGPCRRGARGSRAVLGRADACWHCIKHGCPSTPACPAPQSCPASSPRGWPTPRTRRR